MRNEEQHLLLRSLQGSAACYDDAVNQDPGSSGSTSLTGDGSKCEYQNEGCYELGQEVQNCIADGRSCAEAAADTSIVSSLFDVIAIENHQDRCAYKAAEHLSYDISGNLAPAHAAAHSSADGNCGIEVCSGHCAE